MEGISESGSDSQNSDLLLANIEKFIHEYQDNNMTAKPSTVKKDKLYDTENLLEILGEKSKLPSRKQPIKPFKRKSEDITKSDDFPKQKISNIKPQQKPVLHVKRKTEDKTRGVLPSTKINTIKPQQNVENISNIIDITKSDDFPKQKISNIKPQQKSVLPSVKRKIEDKTRSVLPSTKINTIKPRQNVENVSNISNSLKCRTTQLIPVQPIKKRRRPKCLQELYAKTETIKEVKFDIPKDIPAYTSTRTASVIIHKSCRTHRCKQVFVDIRNDSRIVKNIIRIKIKHEVIDLTSEDVRLNLVINYPREEFLPEYVICDPLPTAQPISIRPFTDLHTAKVSKADVHVHLTNTVIDLTLENDESGSTVVASEKECAIKILPSLHKFHQISQLNRIMEGALDEVGEQTLNFSSRQTKTIALTLIETLSGLYVKNFKIERFLEFLTFKFVQKYKVSVSMKDLAYYLQSMLVSLNRQHCSNQFLTNFAKEIDKVVRIKCEINDNESSSNLNELEEKVVVFTEKQLEQLYSQIHQYNYLIAKYNQYNMLEIPAEISYEVKNELLELNGHQAQ